jgi:heparosan-N-sulfate-glucuronate 5-epimerase
MLAYALLILTGLLIAPSACAADPLVHQYDRSRCPTNALFDANGAALVDYGPPLGRRYNPVTVSQYAIACERSFQLSRDHKFWKAFTAQIRYLEKHAIADGPDRAYYEYDFAWPGYGLAPGWRSGLAQGLAISALIRYYRDTGARRVLPLITKLKAYMLKPAAEGGLAVISPEGGLWIEEFPSDPPSFVLNGFVSAVFALYEYTRLFPKDQTARRQLDDALASLRSSLPAYDTGDWALLDRRAPPYPRANDNYMPVYIKQLETLAEISGDPFYTRMSLRWRSFFEDVNVRRAGNTEQRPDGTYRSRTYLPVVLPTNILRDNVEAIDSTPAYEGFGADSLLHPVGGHTGDYASYFGSSVEGPAFIELRLKRSAKVNTLVLGLYNVELYPLDLKILLRDEFGPWREVAYERASDRRHFAYYFDETEVCELRVEAENYHGQNRLVLGEMLLGAMPRPKPVTPSFGSFLSGPVTLEGSRLGFRIEAQRGAEQDIAVMYRHAADLEMLDGSPWEPDFLDPLGVSEQPLHNGVYQFRILYRGKAIRVGWNRPAVLQDGRAIEIKPASLGATTTAQAN